MNQDIRLNLATQQIHIAAQYLAMMGKYFVPKKKDDSHTNFGWDQITRQFETHSAGNASMRMFLRPEDLRLGLGIEAHNLMAKLDLPGLTQEEGTDWVRAQLQALDFDANIYEISPHYDLPAYGNPGQRPFEIADLSSFHLFSDLRGWAKEIIVQHKNKFSMAQDARTWPHHFDHGCYVPLAKDPDGNVTSSISFGLAIHDGLQPSHYLYVTHWAVERTHEIRTPKLSFGRWEQEKMHGALLPISTLDSTEFTEQTERAQLFMHEAINASLDFLQIPRKEN